MGAFLKCNLPLLGACALGAILALWGLDHHAFWDDEANTAIFARNLLTTGELRAWDGQNLIGYRNGAELDSALHNTYMPPLQYWVTAGSFALLGPGTVSGRLPFVLAGVLSVWLLGLLMRTLVGTNAVSWLAPLLLAVSPAFLLYIRNCRYYALSAALLLSLLVVFVAAGKERRSAISLALAAGITALLWLNHYFSAAYGVAMLPLLMLLPRFRTRPQLLVLAAVLITSVGMGAWILWTRNPFGAGVAQPDTHPWWERFATLSWWHLRDLGTFEFIPVTLTLALPLPWLLKRLQSQRELAKIGLALAGMIILSSLVTAAVSPQPLDQSNVADMRQQVAVIPLGAGLAAIAVRILWTLGRPLAVVVAALVALTNLPHLGFAGKGSGMLPPRGVECTLGQYLYEVTHDYQTSTEALVSWIEALPPQSVVFIYPPFMAYPPMFYAPQMRYCCQLDGGKELSDEVRHELPSYVFWENAEVGWAFISADPPPRPEGPLDISYRGQTYDLGHYTFVDYRDIFREDRSRPEIPWHSFDPSDFETVPYRGFFIATVERSRL